MEKEVLVRPFVPQAKPRPDQRSSAGKRFTPTHAKGDRKKSWPIRVSSFLARKGPFASSISSNFFSRRRCRYFFPVCRPPLLLHPSPRRRKEEGASGEGRRAAR